MPGKEKLGAGRYDVTHLRPLLTSNRLVAIGSFFTLVRVHCKTYCQVLG